MPLESVSTSGRIFIKLELGVMTFHSLWLKLWMASQLHFQAVAMNQQGSVSTQEQRILSAQSVVIDPSGKKGWIVDTGKACAQSTTYGGPKLIEVILRPTRSHTDDSD